MHDGESILPPRRIPSMFVMSHELGRYIVTPGQRRSVLAETNVRYSSEKRELRSTKLLRLGHSLSCKEENDGRGWDGQERTSRMARSSLDSASIGTYVISFRPRFRKSLIFQGAFLLTFRSPNPATGILTWNSFAALRRDSSRKFTALVVRAVT